MAILFQLVLSLMAIFIILLVLVQRGRGGGLAGALGGPGGSSAFGAKAGDTFTKITIWAVSIWIVTCLLASLWFNNQADAFGAGDASLGAGSGEITATTEDDAAATEEGTPAEGAVDAPADSPAEETAADE